MFPQINVHIITWVCGGSYKTYCSGVSQLLAQRCWHQYVCSPISVPNISTQSFLHNYLRSIDGRDGQWPGLLMRIVQLVSTVRCSGYSFVHHRLSFFVQSIYFAVIHKMSLSSFLIVIRLQLDSFSSIFWLYFLDLPCCHQVVVRIFHPFMDTLPYCPQVVVITILCFLIFVMISSLVYVNYEYCPVLFKNNTVAKT